MSILNGSWKTRGGTHARAHFFMEGSERSVCSFVSMPRDQVGVEFKDLDVTSCAACRMKYEKLRSVIKIQRRREKKDGEE